MKKSLLLGALALAMAPSVFSAEKASSQTELRKFEKSILNESMANREGKKFTVNASLFGINHRAGSTSLEVGYHFDANNILTLSGTTMSGIESSDDEVDQFDELRKRHGKGTSAAIGLKHFVSNSFYVKPEIYTRNQEFVYTAIAFGDVVLPLEEGKINDQGVNFRIGNQWQWENFTLGCDWVGLKQSLGGTKEGTVKDGELSGISTLLNFYLGATF